MCVQAREPFPSNQAAFNKHKIEYQQGSLSTISSSSSIMVNTEYDTVVSVRLIITTNSIENSGLMN
jgi:hypothetical protein